MTRPPSAAQVLFACIVASGCGDAGVEQPVAGAGGTVQQSGGSSATSNGFAGGASGGSQGLSQGGQGTGGNTGGAGGSNTCSPVCGDRVCGPDPVCGEPCGVCNAGLECVAGECRSPAPLKENGSTCSANGECASGICAASSIGESRCYGTSGANDACGDTFDCLGGSCLEPIPGTGSASCVPGIDLCYDGDVSGPCIDYTVAFCQLIQICDTDVSASVPVEYGNFDYCIGSECLSSNDGVGDLTPTECAQGVAGINSGTFPCP